MSQPNPSHSLLPSVLAEDLARLNPWWQGQPGPRMPAFQRWLFNRLYRLLLSGLTPAVVLRGPRRVGKTVLLASLLPNCWPPASRLPKFYTCLSTRLEA